MTNTRFTESRNRREGWYWGYGKLSQRHFRTEEKRFSLKHTKDRGARKDQP